MSRGRTRPAYRNYHSHTHRGPLYNE